MATWSRISVFCTLLSSVDLFNVFTLPLVNMPKKSTEKEKTEWNNRFFLKCQVYMLVLHSQSATEILHDKGQCELFCMK